MGFFMQCIENGHNQVTKAAEKVVCAYTHKGTCSKKYFFPGKYVTILVVSGVFARFLERKITE